MLAPLVVDLLISCTVLMLAGWTYDVVGKWTGGNRRVACCTESSVIRLRKRIDREDRTVCTRHLATPSNELFHFDQADRGDG
jgi:hypothetical protein